MADLGPLTDRVNESPQAHVASALRSLIDQVVSAPLRDATLIDAAYRIEQIRSDLAAAASTQESQGDRSNDRYLAANPVSGILNPIAAPLALEVVEGAEGGSRELRGTVNYGTFFEGPPGLVHGGHVAAVLDEALGMANYAADMGALTGTLTVRYRKPTPLRTDLRIEARFLGREGRKIRTWAGLFRENELLAEADGLFIALSPEMAAEMAARG
jgi:acyl-coenzyme A thioesterase PaaI-like protein